MLMHHKEDGMKTKQGMGRTNPPTAKDGRVGWREEDPNDERYYQRDYTDHMKGTDEAIARKLDDPLSKEAMTSGVFGRDRQHGSDLSEYTPRYDREED